MRIQHNIMAMSAYRNYTNNVSAMKKNLEKLSSGYKINRAGDDAAGLAISEKMRAQISGLETAQKNAKDGISLVQTAEGALTEVHDMMNRMITLATQSANGTYQDAPDREQLQKEVNQLLEEIDRIAESSNFNGIKLLDGSLAQTTTAADDVGLNMKDAAAAITHIADGVADKGPSRKTKFELDLTEVSVTNNGIEVSGATDVTVQIASSVAGGASAKQKYKLTFSSAAAQKASGGTIKVTIAGKEVEISVGTDALGKTTVAKAVADKLGTTLTIAGKTYNVAAAASAITLEAASNGTVAAGDKLTTGTVKFSAGKTVKDDMVVELKFSDATIAKITIAYSSTDNVLTGAELASEVMKSLANGGSTAELAINGTVFTVTNNKGVLTFEMKDDPTAEFTGDLTTTLTAYGSDGTTKLAEAGGANTGNKNDLGLITVQGEGIGVHMTDEGYYAGTRVQAQGSFDLADAKIGLKDGTALKIGNETYVFAIGQDSEYKDMKGNVVRLTDVASSAGTATIAALAAKRLSALTKGNTMFDITTNNKDGTVLLTERKNSGIDYLKNNLEGDDKDDLNDVSDPAAAWKDLVQVGTANKDAKPASTSGGLMLQIGDTAEDFNQLRVSINDCHTAALGISGLDISNQDAAADAITKIKNAINYVSDVRGTLGATQNRLDHTINNLSVMTENIQDAESTIRDTDVAEEMMAYTKNNILIQSAQAMLAQANQVPQGVLQLLQ